MALQTAFLQQGALPIAAEVSVCLFQWKTPSILYGTERGMQVPKNPAAGPGKLTFRDPRTGPRSLHFCVCVVVGNFSSQT